MENRGEEGTPNARLTEANLALQRFDEEGDESALHEAHALLSEAINDDPLLAKAFLGRAKANAQLEAYAEAEEDARRARQLFQTRVDARPGDWQPRLDLASAYVVTGGREDRARALHHLREAVRLAPTESCVHAALGEHLATHNFANYPEAIEALTRAMELAAPTPELLLMRGDCHDSLHQSDRALADFTQGMALAPKDWRFYNRRAERLMYLARQSDSPLTDPRWLRASMDYEQCRKLNPVGYNGHPPEYVIELTEPPPTQRRLVFDLNLCEESALPVKSGAEGGRLASRQIREDAFAPFESAFNLGQRFAHCGITVFRRAELPLLQLRLTEHRAALDGIHSYQDFRASAIRTGWYPVLIRRFSCEEQRQHWGTWLSHLKAVSDGLRRLLNEGIERNLALWVWGI